MPTARQIITAALRKLGATSANDTPSAEDIDIGLEALNAVIDSKSTAILNIHTITPYRFQFIPGQYNYELGPTGDWVTERPMRLEKAKLMMNPIIVNAPVLTYGYFLSLDVRNGYDGDVGIPGHIGETAPFVANPSPVSQDFGSETQLTSAGRDGTTLYCGAGVGNVPTVSPMTGSRTFADVEYGFQQPVYYFPSLETDSVWVVEQTFNGSGGAFSITVVVGPSTSEGEKYIVTGSAGSPYDITVGVQRILWSGDR